LLAFPKYPAAFKLKMKVIACNWQGNFPGHIQDTAVSTSAEPPIG